MILRALFQTGLRTRFVANNHAFRFKEELVPC